MTLTQEKYNFETKIIPEIEKQYNVKVLLAYVRGSHMYGTNIETSDVDITFIYQQPTESILRGDYKEQINHGGNDVVGYEIQRYIQLLSLNNPNILESLDIPEWCLIYKWPAMDKIFEFEWLSKRTKETILGYAHSQIKKATGLNKHMNRADVGKKDLIDFCHIIDGDKSEPLRQWIKEKQRDLSIEGIEKSSGLVKIPNGKGLYGLYLDVFGDQNFRGILKDSESTQLRTSSIPKGYFEQPYTMWYNQDGYEVWNKEYQSYIKWVKERSEVRFQMNKKAGQNVDLKNAMHLMRLLEMVEKISLGKGLQVKSDNVQYLLDVRNGRYDYDHLIEEAEKRTEQIKKNFETVNMQESVDLEQAKDLLLYFRNHDNRR